MTKFLGTYRGAALYEMEVIDPSEGQQMGSKLMAQAVIPNQQNMKVDFVEEADTPKKAREKLKKTIDRYLEEHDIDQFEIDIL